MHPHGISWYGIHPALEGTTNARLLLWALILARTALGNGVGIICQNILLLIFIII